MVVWVSGPGDFQITMWMGEPLHHALQAWDVNYNN